MFQPALPDQFDQIPQLRRCRRSEGADNNDWAGRLPANESQSVTDVEILRPDLPRGRFRFALFDFDGTLSLIREGWPQVMIPLMVEVLRGTGTAEDEVALTGQVEDFVMRLN